jgi:hypothetical protein
MSRKLQDVPYTVEHFYRFHTKLNRQGLPDTSSIPKWFWFNYSNASIGRLIKDSTDLPKPPTLAPWVNISVFRPYPRTGVRKSYYEYYYPKHIATLHPRHKEYLKCKLCGSSIAVYRHTQRYNPRVVRKYSSYHPQPAETCDCKELAVLVDHRGLLRVYARDLKTVELYSGASYHESKTFPLFTPVPLDLAPIKQIQSRILDGPKFLTSPLDGLGKYVTLTDDAWSSESYSRYSNTYKILQKVNHVNVSNYVASQTSSFLKFPVPKLSDIQRDSDYIKYSKMYSRVFNLVVHTRHGVHFPSGLSLKASHPFYKEFMSTPLPKGFLEDTYLRISIKEPTPADILRRALQLLPFPALGVPPTILQQD